jgi:hypothetical protein
VKFPGCEICDACETVSWCARHHCLPLVFEEPRVEKKTDWLAVGAYAVMGLIAIFCVVLPIYFGVLQ